MNDNPRRIDPPGCGCGDPYSQPFDTDGDPDQFRGLFTEEMTDATGYHEYGAWMRMAARECPARFSEWIAEEYAAKRLLSRTVLQAKASNLLLGGLLDD